MVLICAGCQLNNPDGARFCNNRGAALATTQTPREVPQDGDVLFSDLVGSTALGEQTDPEALRALLARSICLGRQQLAETGRFVRSSPHGDCSFLLGSGSEALTSMGVHGT